MGEPRLDTYTMEQYVALEELDDRRYEFHDGRLWPVDDMAGGTWEHSLICSNAVLALDKGSPGECVAFSSEVKIFVEENNSFLYPDAALACRPERHGPGLANPMIIIEVLSNSSERRDRNEKFGYYRRVPSLKYYMLIHQHEKKIEVFNRGGDQTWSHTIHFDELDLPPFEFRVEDFYKNV